MSAIDRDKTPDTQMVFVDELDASIAEALTDPAYRAAFEDALQRHELIDVLVGIRRALGLTQSEVAKRMGVKQPSVSGFENEGSDPRLSTIQRYARAVESTLSIRPSTVASCDWLPRSDGYAQSAETHHVHLKVTEPSPLAMRWGAAKARRSDFVRAA